MNKIKEKIDKVLSTLIDCIVPSLPILIGVGMLKVVLILLSDNVLHILSYDSNTYIVLSFVADAGYYFMPIFIAVASADVFKVDRYLAALCGAMLISPEFVRLVEEGRQLSVYGIPIASTNYGNQILSSIIIVWLMSYVCKFLNKILNDNAKPILFPLLTILIMVPIAFCAVGPLGVIMGNGLVSLILWLKDLGPIGNAIMCAIIPFITIFGLGGANLSAMLLLASTGVDPILFFSNVLYNNILGAVTLALYLKNKNPETLAASITSAVGGSSEPALFGFVMKDYKALASLSISGFIAGFYAGLKGVKCYAMASFGTFGLLTTIGPDSSIVDATIALVIGCLCGFVFTYLTHKEKSR